MIIFYRKNKLLIFLLVFFVFYIAPLAVFAADGVKLSITPPLIKNNVEPGQTWASTIKLVNNNEVEIDAYVELADFKGGKEDGTVEFINTPESNEEGGEYLLSRWIEIEPGPFKIAAQKSLEIPFVIKVPEEAGPGGHYAAILTGTMPPENINSGSAIKISSLLASLILLNVSGEVEERGMIREFSSDKEIYTKPEPKFIVRFQNDGNVHIQPQGEIRIYNILKKEKGYIKINHGSSFGNVLPGDIRRWEYSWQGDDSIFSMGRYRAVLTLGYGNQGRETAEQILYFWVIYPKPLMVIIGSILFLIFLVAFSIRRYIRRAITRTQAQAGLIKNPPLQGGNKVFIAPRPDRGEEETVVNLKARPVVENTKDSGSKLSWKILKRYFLVLLIIIISFAAGFIYLNLNKEMPAVDNTGTVEAETDTEKPEITEIEQSPEEVIIEAEPKAATTTNEVSEVITPDEIVEIDESDNNVASEDITLAVLNGSGRSGLASSIQEKLAPAGYSASRVGNASSFNFVNTVIKYKKGLTKEAEAIGELIGGQIEYEEVLEQVADIVVIVGRSYR